MSSDERTAPGAVSAGRGVLYISLAKLYFMFAGAAIEFALPTLLGRFSYGAYGIVNAWVSNVNGVVVQGTIAAVSRYTTADPERAGDVKAAGVRMHLALGLPLAILLAATAPIWARLAHDPGKTGLLALAAAVVALYAFYSVFVGSANGTRHFHKQAGLDVTFATLRSGGIIAAALLGLGVWGAIGAWVAAAAVILVISVVVIGAPRRLGAGEVKPMARFLGAVALYLILMNLVMSADQLLLKRLSTEWFLAHPDWLLAHGAAADALGPAAATQADGQVGYYRAVQNLARLPYQLMIAVTFVVFPLVSRATFERDGEKTRGYIRTTMRYSLIAAGIMGVALAANATEVLGIPYTAEFKIGGRALLFLALGNVAFALLSISGTILNAAGRTSDAVLLVAITLGLLVVGLFLGTPRAEPGAELLTLCAATTASAMLLGATGAAWLLWRRFGGFLPLATLVRVLAAAAAAIGVGQTLQTTGKLMALAEMVLAAAIYAAVLVVTREVGRADLAAFTRVFRRGGR
jgi:stage V sporulation protein B